MPEPLDFDAEFARLRDADASEHHVLLGGIDVRLVRVRGGGEGRWDRHDDCAEIVVVWSGDFDVAFRDGTLRLGAGGSCVVPLGAEHRGTSREGAEVALFKARPLAP